MFRCPPININRRSHRRFFYIYYVSSNLLHHSVTLFNRENQKGKLPQQEINIYEIQMEPIIRDILRRRVLPGPLKIITDTMRHIKSYREIEDEINYLEGVIQMPSTLVQLELSKPENLRVKIDEKRVWQVIYPEKWLIDRVTQSFSKVKNLKSSK